MRNIKVTCCVDGRGDIVSRVVHLGSRIMLLYGRNKATSGEATLYAPTDGLLVTYYKEQYLQHGKFGRKE